MLMTLLRLWDLAFLGMFATRSRERERRGEGGKGKWQRSRASATRRVFAVR